jgi:hypothetical protein
MMESNTRWNGMSGVGVITDDAAWSSPSVTAESLNGEERRSDGEAETLIEVYTTRDWSSDSGAAITYDR